MEKAQKDNVSVDLQDLLLRLTFDNICGLTLGKDPQTLSPELPANPFSVAFDAATEATMHRFLLYYIIHFSFSYLYLFFLIDKHYYNLLKTYFIFQFS